MEGNCGGRWVVESKPNDAYRRDMNKFYKATYDASHEVQPAQVMFQTVFRFFQNIKSFGVWGVGCRSSDPDVNKEALMCVQKLMVH